MDTVKEIEKLIKNSKEIKDLFDEKIPRWRSDPKTYDKTRFGFVEGGSGGWYESCETNIHFAAWCGTYGDSSTYKQISLDGDVFKKYFTLYLNRNKEEIMRGISELIDAEAKAIKEKAESELRSRLSAIESIA